MERAQPYDEDPIIFPLYKRGHSWLTQIKKRAHRLPNWDMVQPRLDAQPTARLPLAMATQVG